MPEISTSLSASKNVSNLSNHLKSLSLKIVRTPLISAVIGLLSVIIIFFTSYSVYLTTTRSLEESYAKLYLTRAEILIHSLEHFPPDLSDTEILNEIDHAWQQLGPLASDEYICLFDEDANLIYHSLAPNTVGNYVGENIVTESNDPEITCLIDISQRSSNYVGGYISSAGQKQIAAFVNIPSKNWTIGVHRSHSGFHEEINSQLILYVAWFIIIIGLVLPLSFLLLFWNARKLEKAEAESKAILSEKEFMLLESQRVAGIGSYVMNMPKGLWISSEQLDSIFEIDHNFNRDISGWLEIVHPDDREMMQQYFQEEVLGKNKEFNKEYRIQGIESKIIKWVHGLGQLKLDQNGNLEKMIGTIQDITREVETRESLKRSQVLLESSVESLKETIVFSIDTNFCYLYFNSFHRLSMHNVYDVDIQIGENILDYFTIPKDRQIAEERLAKTLSGENFVKIDQYGKPEDPLFFEVFYNPIVQENGEIMGASVFAREISKRILSEKALQQSEEQFKLLMQQTPYVVEIYDIDGLQINVNQAYEKLWGFPAETTVNKFNVLKSKEVEETGLMTYVKRAYSGEAVSVPEYEFNPTGETESGGFGRLRWLKTNIFPLKTAGGDVRNIVITHEDISDRKMAELTLQNLVKVTSAKFGEAFFDSMAIELSRVLAADYILIGELFGYQQERIKTIAVAVNGQIEANFDYELEGTPCDNVVGKNICSYLTNVAEQFPEDTLLKDMGVEGYVGMPLYDTSDKPLGIVAALYRESLTEVEFKESVLQIIASRISSEIERARVNLALQESEERFRTVVEDQTDFIVRWLPDGTRTFVNDSYCRYFNINPEKAVGTSYFPFAKEEDKTRVEEITSTLSVFTPVSTSEYQINHPDGSIRWNRWTDRALFNNDGELIEFQSVGQDITEYKEMEIARESALEEARKAEKVKSLFLANMSHEIRTPLNGILGFTELLKDRLEDIMDDDLEEYFNIISGSSQRLMHTVHEILDISQIDAEAFETKPEILDLNTLLNDQTQTMQPEAIRKGLKLSFTSQIQGQAHINADQYCINQAILNLLSNAVKYTESGRVDVILKPATNKYLVDIIDTGIGMSDEYITRLFTPFSQESEGYTKNFQGVGLGLSLVKRYLDLNMVEIEVNSKKGKGSTFSLSFEPHGEFEVKPVSDKKTPAPETQTPSSRSDKPYILVVEDDIVSQRLVRAYLKASHELDYAVSVREAKTKLKQRKPDLILLDLSLEGKEDGLALVNFIRQDKQLEDIVIIATTAHAFITDIDNSIEAGCNDYLAKPIPKDELIAKVNQHLN